MNDLIFPPPTLSQAKDGAFELYTAITGGGVSAAHIANDITGVLQYAASVALPDDHTRLAIYDASPEVAKVELVDLLAPFAEAKRRALEATGAAEDVDAAAEKIPWARLAMLLLKVLPLLLPLLV